MITCMKLAIVKHRMAGLFRQANNPFIKCNFHSFFFHIPQREGTQECSLNVPSSCQPLCHIVTYHVSFTSHQVFFVCVCVCTYECARAVALVCTCRGQRRTMGIFKTGSLTVQEASPFWPDFLAI